MYFGKSIYHIILIMWFFYFQQRKSPNLCTCPRHIYQVSYDVCQGVLWDFFKKFFNTAVNRAFEAALYAPFRFPWYKCGWFLCWSAPEYRQGALYLFAGCKTFLQTNVWNYEGKPYLLILRRTCTSLWASSRYSSGQAVCCFLKRTPLRFLYFCILYTLSTFDKAFSVKIFVLSFLCSL